MAGAHIVRVPRTEPILVQAEWSAAGTPATETVEIRPSEISVIPATEATLRSAAGDAFHVRPQLVEWRERAPRGQDRSVSLDRIGICYQAVQWDVIVQLGVAQAFIELKIVPQCVTGLGTGSLAALAHALDPIEGRGIDLVAGLLAQPGPDPLGAQIDAAAAGPSGQFASVRNPSALYDGLSERIEQSFNLHPANLGAFEPPRPTMLLLPALDLMHGTDIWFPPEAPLDTAVMVASTIPGFFPWHVSATNGTTQTLVAANAASSRPLYRLTQEGCGRIYGSSCGSFAVKSPPADLVDTALRFAASADHQALKLDEDLLRSTLGPGARVVHLHPDMGRNPELSIAPPDAIRAGIEEAARMTRAWLKIEPTP
jgi:hypothetical protein